MSKDIHVCCQVWRSKVLDPNPIQSKSLSNLYKISLCIKVQEKRQEHYIIINYFVFNPIQGPDVQIAYIIPSYKVVLFKIVYRQIGSLFKQTSGRI